MEVPDINVVVCDLLPDVLQSKKNYSTELFGQTIISSGAFVIAFPDLAEDHLLVNTAGVVGALRSYEAILKSHPNAKCPLLSEAEKWQDTRKAKPDAKDGELDRLLRIYQSGYLETFVYLNPVGHFQSAADQWKELNSEAVQTFEKWAKDNSVAIDALQQPVRVEWLGGDR